MAVITISRMYGSGGSEIAARVAAELGWSLLDNALVDAVAERLGITRAEVEAREERVPTLVERLADSLALAAPEALPPATGATLPPSEERMIAVTERIIRETVAQGDVVLVGRGAQSMLASHDEALHIFCYAPRAVLIARAAQRLAVSEKEAERAVDDTNRQREQYVKKYWKRSWSAHENYHLCVNTYWLGIEGTTTVIVGMARRMFVDGDQEPGNRDQGL